MCCLFCSSAIYVFYLYLRGKSVVFSRYVDTVNAICVSYSKSMLMSYFYIAVISLNKSMLTRIFISL